MSVLISHPSVAPFVQQAARALLEAGKLDRFITTLRYDEASRGQRWACRAARCIGFDLESQLKRRTVTELPPGSVESHPLSEIARLLSGQLDGSGRLTDLVWERTEPAFDRLVARRVRADHDAVYGFEYCSLATFKRARDLGVRVVYDMPAPEPRFVQKLLEAEIDRLPELRTPYHLHTAAREERRISRRRAEWDSADLVIAASRFTRDSFAQAGLDVAKVAVVPYGAPPAISDGEAASSGSREGEPLRFIWAGTFSIRKGAHYLLEAWRRGDFGRRAELKVFGTVALPERLLQPPPANVDFAGSLPRGRLMEHYRASDALLFPTLCDGFGMVVTEAWSQGLPVITTDRAGAADLLRPGQNGLLIRAGDAAALGEAIEWCLGHRAELHAMREPSAATAAGWQWSDYRRSLAAALGKAGAFGPGSEQAK
jgi:glycosyltransferase involved in cell wall biosynthesis